MLKKAREFPRPERRPERRPEEMRKRHKGYPLFCLERSFWKDWHTVCRMYEFGIRSSSAPIRHAHTRFVLLTPVIIGEEGAYDVAGWKVDSEFWKHAALN